nr:hypothetical protein [Tanacetum cinerariifolium]
RVLGVRLGLHQHADSGRHRARPFRFTSGAGHEPDHLVSPDVLAGVRRYVQFGLRRAVRPALSDGGGRIPSVPCQQPSDRDVVSAS